jgi:hypothetical protein
MAFVTGSPSATDFIDRTSADKFIPEIWSSQALIQREARLVFAELVDRRFESDLKVGDVVHVPGVSNLGAARSKGINAVITYESLTEEHHDITVTTNDYVAIAVEDIAKVQTDRDMLALYAGKMGYALALAVDDNLAGLPDNFTQTVGTLAAEADADDWIRAIQYLDDADVPAEDRAFIISPAARAGLLKLDRYVNNDYSSLHDGPKDNQLKRAYTRSFYDVPVYVSTNVEGTNAAGHDNTLLHVAALALIMQMMPTVRHQYDIDYLTDKVAMHHIYGSAEMRDDHGVWMKGA